MRSDSPLRYVTLAANFVEAEQTKMNDCYFDKKDWRTCRKEASLSAALADFHGTVPIA